MYGMSVGHTYTHTKAYPPPTIPSIPPDFDWCLDLEPSERDPVQDGNISSELESGELGDHTQPNAIPHDTTHGQVCGLDINADEDRQRLDDAVWESDSEGEDSGQGSEPEDEWGAIDDQGSDWAISEDMYASQGEDDW